MHLCFTYVWPAAVFCYKHYGSLQITVFFTLCLLSILKLQSLFKDNIYYRECLAGAIQFSETAVVKCPFRNDEYSCESHLQEREVKSVSFFFNYCYFFFSKNNVRKWVFFWSKVLNCRRNILQTMLLSKS